MRETHLAVANDPLPADRRRVAISPHVDRTPHSLAQRALDRRTRDGRALGSRPPRDRFGTNAGDGDRTGSATCNPGDGSPERAPPARADSPDAGEVPVPDWVPSDDVITSDSDRQVLVVGETVTGLTLALLLRHAGYDPLLVAGADQSVPSRVTYLWPPALRTLAAVDVADRTLDDGVAVDSLSARRLDSGGVQPLVQDASDVAVPPVVVRTRALRQALLDQFPERLYGGERTVETVSGRDDGLAVEFADGVREWFDVVVDASDRGATRPSRDGAGENAAHLWQYETTVHSASSTESVLSEGWSSSALVQRLPAPDGPGDLCRVTTAEPDLPPAVTGDGNGDAVLGDGTDLAAELADVEPTKVSQGVVPDAGTRGRRWAAGRVASCGGAACPLAPASGARVSLGIEGALAFVRRLARERRPVTDVVDAFGASRASRVTALRRPADTPLSNRDYPTPEALASPLETLGALRTVALAPFLGSSLVERQRDGFD